MVQKNRRAGRVNDGPKRVNITFREGKKKKR